ncbi:GNAT family N-acetyltransferase [Marinitenerispora sediminis]|uniref:N-acetyltransferase n=1 Tax=Marinitenerispora sediminis TaxID=1931232 RepID=A0A368TCU9_9ACTN|nr:GNAT family N-acetyltransferase [Marinitenerispora sediminis]RCV52456.1 N-acetyltransferase [Marinitenerispora sediminis]RCV54963.1 N-acetyltransferase [Marinitenerispora sediminis]RCV61424.1 N-acetyltransferase [Marinitenerispora sediminis]
MDNSTYPTPPSASTIIRPREMADIEATTALLIEVHRRDGYPVEGVADPRAWLQPPGLMRSWIAELNGAIVGHVSLTAPPGDDQAVALWRTRTTAPASRVAVLARLFVHPETRRQSVGKALVQAATGYAQSRQTDLLLDVLEKDTAAIRLYESLGWTFLATATHSFGRDSTFPARYYAAPLQENSK